MLDIWGMSFTYKKPTSEMKFIKMLEQEQMFRKWYYSSEFVYSFKKKMSFSSKKRNKNDFLFPRYLKHYYLILKLSDFSKMQSKAVSKGDVFESTYMTLLECSLFMIVFSMHWMTNIFMMSSMINNKVFTINGEIKSNSNMVAKVGDMMSVHHYYSDLMHHDLFLSYINNIVFWKTPGFMFLNYKLMLSIFWSPPLQKDLAFMTDEMDIYFGSEYYFPSPS